MARWQRQFSRFSRVLLGAVAMACAPGCVDNGSFTASTTTTTTGSNSSITSLSALSSGGTSSSSTDDGAKGSCASIDSSNPERQYCIDCYNTLLASKCPGVEDPADCKDTTVADTFTELVNQCVNTSMKAGFTCTTTCSDGYTLDSASCTCVADTASDTSSGTSGTDLIDRGQTDFGPPIVTAEWPTGSLVGVTISTSGFVGPTSCAVTMTGALAFWMGVRNRAGTQVQSNHYGTPTVSSSTCTSSVVAPTYATSTGLAPVGTNVYATMMFGTSGTTSVSGSAGGGIGWIKGLYAGSGGVNMTPSPTPGATGTVSITQSLEGPRFVTRDQYGNIYFTSGDGDPADGYPDVIGVLCLNNTSATGNPWCSSVGRGTFVLIATETQTVIRKYSNEDDTNLKLGKPYGIAVDQYGNVFFTDYSRHYLGVYCPTKAGGGQGLCTGKTTNRLYAITNETAAGGSGSTDAAIATAKLSSPMGIDLATNGSGSYNIFIADSGNGKIRAVCGYDDDRLCDGVAANSTTTLSSPTLSSPSDVKVNWNGNLFIADTGNHRILAQCYTINGGDLCQTGGVTSATTAGASITIVGQNGLSGDTGDGAPVAYAKITKPYALAIAKRYADDTSSTVTTANFRDNNLAFTESLYVPSSSSSTTGGNVMRMVCGQAYTNSDGIANTGFCRGVNTGYVIRLTGKSGTVSTSSNDQPASSATVVSMTGLTYDINKNLAFGTGYCSTGACSTAIYENGIRVVMYAAYDYDTTNKRDRVCGVKYSFIDSNQQTSYYCLQLQAQTQCLYDRCECAPVPVNNSVSSFWSSSTSSASCPTY